MDMKAETKAAQSTTTTTAATIKYSPWLTLKNGRWCGGRPQQPFSCRIYLQEFFDLKPARKGWVTQIRFRVSTHSLGNDYEVRDKYESAERWIWLATAETVVCIYLYSALSRLLYTGCWAGLESREIAMTPLK